MMYELGVVNVLYRKVNAETIGSDLEFTSGEAKSHEAKHTDNKDKSIGGELAETCNIHGLRAVD